jgi:hypothetical protein
MKAACENCRFWQALEVGLTTQKLHGECSLPRPHPIALVLERPRTYQHQGCPQFEPDLRTVEDLAK